jgi:hypothetical protein
MLPRSVLGQPSQGKRIPPTIPTQALEETAKAYSAAMQRTGTSPESRMMWLLSFLYQDVAMLSRGDRLNLSDEIQVYASPLKTGYYVWELPDGASTEAIRSASTLSSKTIAHLQSILLQDIQKVLTGTVVKTNPRIAYIGCAWPGTSKFQLTRSGNRIDLLRLTMFLDVEQVGLSRIRTCARGSQPQDRALAIRPCQKMFFATDLRQRFCSPECGKETRWKRYWKIKGEEIKRKRRKGET